MLSILLGLHIAAFTGITYLFYKRSTHIAYHFSMSLAIIISLWNTLAFGLLLNHLLSAYLLYMIIIITIAIGAISSILTGIILDFQSFYSGSVTGVMGGLMGPMLGDLLSESQAIVLFIIIGLFCFALLFISLRSTQIRREI